jgi:hypothetical protein
MSDDKRNAGTTSEVGWKAPSPEAEALAGSLAEEAVAGFGHLLSADEQAFFTVLLETDLLFDARYADLMKALVLDEQQRDASETLPRDPAASVEPAKGTKQG